MLLEECDTVGRVVLQKLLSVLDGNPLPDALAAILVIDFATSVVSLHLCISFHLLRYLLSCTLCATVVTAFFVCCLLSVLGDLELWIQVELAHQVSHQKTTRRRLSS